MAVGGEGPLGDTDSEARASGRALHDTVGAVRYRAWQTMCWSSALSMEELLTKEDRGDIMDRKSCDIDDRELLTRC